MWGKKLKAMILGILLGFFLILGTTAPAKAVSPSDMPTLSCDELIGAGVASAWREYVWDVAGVPHDTWNQQPEINWVGRAFSSSTGNAIREETSTKTGTQYCTYYADNASSMVWFGYTPHDNPVTVDAANTIEIDGLTYQILAEEGGVTFLGYNTEEFTFFSGPAYGNGGMPYPASPGDIDLQTTANFIPQMLAAVQARWDALNTPTPEPVAVVASPDVPAQNVPSVLSSLRSMFDWNVTVGSVGTVAGGSVVLGFLVALPTVLLQRTVRNRYHRTLGGVRRQFEKFGVAWKKTFAFLTLIPQGISIPVGVVLTAGIASAMSPTWSLDLATLRLFFSLLVGILAETLLIYLLLAWRLRVNGGSSRLELRIGSLLIVAATVLFTRLTHFQPGIMFGLVFALVLVTTSQKATEVHANIYEVVGAMALGTIAWVLYSLVVSLHPGNGYWSTLTKETLAAIVLGTLTALPLVLLPLGNLPGREIMKHKLWVWIVLLVLSLALFFGIVMPFPESIQTVDWPLTAWIIFFVGYAIVALAIWLIDVVLTRREEQHATAGKITE